MMIENKKFRMEVNKEGYVSNLTMKDDPYQMKWMIEDSYLQEKNYKDADKLFGFFELIADKEKFGSQMNVPVLKETEKGIEVVYEFETLKVKQFYYGQIMISGKFQDWLDLVRKFIFQIVLKSIWKFLRKIIEKNMKKILWFKNGKDCVY